MIKSWLGFFIFIAIAVDTFAEQFDLERNWTFQIEYRGPEKIAVGAGSPIPFPNAEKPNSIVLATFFGVIRVDGNGKQLFSYSTGEEGAGLTPAVGDLNADGSAEIIQATYPGIIHCISGEGKCLWKTDLKDRLHGFGGILISDIDSDGKYEILINAESGAIHCLNHDGSRRWQANAEPKACMPTASDIDGDGKAEIFYGTDYDKIFCLNYQGEYRWHCELPGRRMARSSPSLVDLNNDGRYELLMPHNSSHPDPAILCLDAHSGKLRWKGRTGMQNYTGTSVVDLDGDGKYEVMVVDKSNTISVFENDGCTRWQTSLTGHGIFFAAAVADFNGDGRFEIFCSCRQTGNDGQTIYLLDDEGKLLREYNEGYSRNASPMIADLDQDGLPEIYLTDGRVDKILVCYALTGTQKNARVLWRCWKKSSTNDGYIKSTSQKRIAMDVDVPKIPPVDKSQPEPVFIGKNLKTIEVPPKWRSKDLIVETKLEDENNFLKSALIWREEVGESIAVPFAVTSGQKSALSIIVRERASQRLVHVEAGAIHTDNFTKDIEFSRNAFARMSLLAHDFSSSDIEIASDLTARFKQKETMLADLIAKAGSSSQSLPADVLKLIEKNRDESNQMLGYAEFLQRIRLAGNRELFYVWEDSNPWDELHPEELYPQNIKPDSSSVFVTALGNELEACAFYLTNLTNKSLFVKIYPYDFRDQSGNTTKSDKVIQLREPINTPDTKGKMVDEVLPLLNQGNTLLLPPRENRKLWISIDTKELDPGTYRCVLGFEAIGMTISVQHIRLEVRVSTVKVPEKSEYAFSTWSNIYIADPDMRQKVVDDVISHKITVFPQISGPQFRLDSDKRLVEDWTAFDQYMLPVKKYAQAMLFNPIHLGVPKDVELIQEEREYWEKECHLRTSAGMKERGFSYEDWGIYVMDEPGLTGYGTILEAIEIARKIKEKDPNIQCFIDPAGMVTPESMKGFEGLIDIYQPEVGLLNQPDRKLVNCFLRLGKKLWFYEAPGPARLFHPLGHYRVKPWIAFDLGCTGSGFWCYHYAGRTNLWRLKTAYPPDGSTSYSVVYNDGLNVIPSRRWEACRDGVEDYHLLMQFKRRIESIKPGKSPKGALAAEAEAFMKAAVERMTTVIHRHRLEEGEFSPYDLDYDDLQKSKAKMIDYLEKLNAN